jgi:hypothetical protein
METIPQAAPSPNGQQTAAGRGPHGRFAPGNGGGPGNPFAAEVGKHRARLFKAARAKDVDQALKTIREIMAKGKDADRLAAAKLLLDRLLGPAIELDILERLEALEEAILKEEKYGSR